MSKLLTLKGGRVSIVDDDIYEWATQKCKTNDSQRWTWRVDKDGYVMRFTNVNNKTYNIFLHREVMGATKGDGKDVHHKNLNPLDNRRDNLVTVDKGTHIVLHAIPGGKGMLTFDLNTNLWGVKIRCNRFHTLQAATNAYIQVTNLLETLIK